MKILASADIHIDDYARYNVDGPKFRLNQFITLAHRLAAIYKEQQCEKIVIAGDSIQKSVIPPETQHVLKEFYTILSDAVQENGGEVIMDMGNHDRDSRSLDTKKEESIITLMDMIPNVRYIHKKEEMIDGLRVGFQDFIPKHELEWFDGKLDILFNHFTDVGPGWNGQEIDKERFGVMFFGDIHKCYKRGNIVSIGNPIPHRLKDTCEGKCIIIDTRATLGESPSDTLNPIDEIHTIKVNSAREIQFKWVDVINEENPFLRIYRPDNKPRYMPGLLKYDVEVPYNLVKESTDRDVDIDLNSIDIDSIIDANLDDTTKAIHTEILQLAKDSLISDSSISMNFSMIRTSIKNFRSIDEFTHTWGKEALRISGDIGAGKSSVANAIMFNFLGNRNISDQFRDTADIKNDILEVDQVLEYQGLFYRISRGYAGKGFVKFWKSNDQDKILLDSYLDPKDPNFYPNETANKQSDIDLMIKNELPFLEMYSLFYISQQSNGLFTEMKKTERIEIISKLLGWNKIVDYSEIAMQMLKDAKAEIKHNESEQDTLNGSINAIEQMNITLDDTDYQSLIAEANTEQTQLSTQITDDNRYQQEVQIYNVNLQNVTNEINKPQPLFDGVEVSIEECDKCLLDSENKIQEYQLADDKARLEYDQSVADILTNKQKVQTFRQNKAQELNDARIVLNNINILQNRSLELDQHIAKLRVSHTEAVQKIDEEITETCNSCGQTIHDENLLSAAKNERIRKADAIQADIDNLVNTLSQIVIPETPDTSSIEADIAKLDAMLVNLDEQYNSVQKPQLCTNLINNEQLLINKYNMHKNSLTIWANDRGTAKSKLEQLQAKRLEIENIPHLEPQIRQALESRINELYSIIAQYQAKEQENAKNIGILNTLQGYKDKLIVLQTEAQSKQDKIEQINEYIDLTSFTGKIVQAILDKTSHVLSTDTMQVKTIEERKNGNHKPDLTLSVLIGEKWKDYSQLSGGQLFFADIKFILRLFDLIGGCGLAIFDESFKFLNPEMIDEIGAEIKEGNITDTMVVTHAETYIHVDKVIHAELNERGITSYNV